MKRLTVLLLLMIPAACSAIKVTLFMDIDTYIKRGQDIVIANCVSMVPNDPHVMYFDGLYLVDVDVIRALKGSREPGRQTIATIYPMTVGKTYLLYGMGGSFDHKTSFLAVPELSVVEIPASSVLKQLDGMPLADEILLLFSKRLAQVKRELAGRTSLTLSLVDKERQAVWARLKNPAPTDAPSKYLNSQLSSETRKLLADYAPPSRADNAELRLSQAVVEDLNRVIRSGLIYHVDRFAGVNLSAETWKLLKQNPRGEDLMRLNLALLLDAYPVGLWRDQELEREKPLLEKAVQSRAPMR